jgi:trigger factor
VKVTLERLPESRVLLDIEVDSERLEKSLDVAYRRVANKARIPGFRPGKAPRPIVERMIGREGLIREALDQLVPDVYNEVLEQEDVQAVDHPELEIVEIDPVRFKATVPVRPNVELNEYEAIRVERDSVDVSDEMVQEQVDMLRRRHATQIPVERPVQWDDIIIGDVVATVDDEPFVEDRDAEFQVRENVTLLVEGLAEAFIGMDRDEEKEVDLELPEDFQIERLKGKTAHFVLTVKDVKEEQLPEPDDDFAQEVNAEEFPTYDSLVERIRNDLRESLERAADARLQQEAIDKMVEVATIEYPRVYVEREIDSLVRDNLGNNRQQYMDYLSRIGQSEAEYRASLEEPAELRVKRSLVLSALADAEGIDVTDEEISAELDKLVEPAGEEAPQLRELFSTEEGRATIRRNILSDKTLARVKEIATLDGEKAAPAAEADEATTKKPRKSRASKKEDAE